jgi:hypothetical protein
MTLLVGVYLFTKIPCGKGLSRKYALENYSKQRPIGRSPEQLGSLTHARLLHQKLTDCMFNGNFVCGINIEFLT